MNPLPAWTPKPGSNCGHRSIGWLRPAPPCCSRPNTSRKLTAWRTASWSSTTGTSSPRVPPANSKTSSVATSSNSELPTRARLSARRAPSVPSHPDPRSSTVNDSGSRSPLPTERPRFASLWATSKRQPSPSRTSAYAVRPSTKSFLRLPATARRRPSTRPNAALPSLAATPTPGALHDHHDYRHHCSADHRHRRGAALTTIRAARHPRRQSTQPATHHPHAPTTRLRLASPNLVHLALPIRPRRGGAHAWPALHRLHAAHDARVEHDVRRHRCHRHGRGHHRRDDRTFPIAAHRPRSRTVGAHRG